MLIALGSQSAPIQIFNGTGHRPNDWCDRFLSNAQFFLGRSSSSPTISTIRTLCLAAVAQMLEVVKGSEASRLLSLMGHLNQLAVSMYLHRTTVLFPNVSPSEAEMRRRAWVTIRLLSLDIAIRTGTIPLQIDSDIEPPFNINNAEHGWIIEEPRTSEQRTTDGTFQAKLAGFLPVLFQIIKTVNSPTKAPPRSETIENWRDQLLRKLKDAESALANQLLQLDFLKILVNRVLLSMYHSQLSFKSKTVIRLSLSILEIQSRWRQQTSSITPGFLINTQGPPTTNCLLSLRRDDFGAAILSLIVAVATCASSGQAQTQFEDVGRIRAAIRESMQDFRDWACRSITHFDEFILLSVAVGCLEGFLNDGGGMMGVLTEVADRIEHTILSGKLWSGGGAGGGGGGSGGAGNVTVTGPGAGGAGGMYIGDPGFLVGGGFAFEGA